MRPGTICNGLITIIFFLMSLLILAGCAPTSWDQQSVPVENVRNKGRLSLFLNLYETDGPDLSMLITAIQFVPENGPLDTHDFESLVVESGKIGGGQKFLTRIVLEPAKYTQMRLVIGEAGQTRGASSQLLPLVTSEIVIDLRTPLTITVGDSKSFFLTWDTKKSLQNNTFYPAVQLAPRVKKLIADVGYVACPDIDTVFMFSTKENRVIDSLGIQGGPSYLFQARYSRDDEVYVLSGKSSQLYGFSPETNGVTAKYNLSTMTQPVHMALSSNGTAAYILDQQLGTVSRLNLISGTVDQQTSLNFDPMYILYLEKHNLLAVSLALSQNVVFLDPKTLKQLNTVGTRSRPDGLLMVDERYLYIAETGANAILAYDLDSNQVFKQISVGFQPTRIFSTNNFMYVVNSGDNTISTIRHGRATISRTISLDGSPLEMAYAEGANHVYVGNREKMALAVMDPLTNAVTGSIELGAVPQGILVLP